MVHFYSGRELIILTTREIFLYGYHSTKPVMTHRLPINECGNQVLFLEDVYCVVGESLLLFNQQGLKDYGEVGCQSAVHIGSNRLILWHQDEDSRLVELTDQEVKEHHRWLNLSQVFSVECINDCGLQTFVVVSPNRTKQLTFLTKSLSATPVCHLQLQQPVSCLWRVNHNKLDYLFMGLADETTILMRLVGTLLEQVWRIDQKLLLAYEDFVVFSTGIYQLDYQRQKMQLFVEDAIEKASVNDGRIGYSTSSSIKIYDIYTRKVQKTIKINAPISALCVNEKHICYSEWNSKVLHFYSGDSSLQVNVSEQVRWLELMSDHLFIGCIRGLVEIYSLNGGVQLKQSFCCGNLPAKLTRIHESIYCMSNMVIAIKLTIQGIIQKSMVSLKNASSLATLNSNLLAVACYSELTVYSLQNTEQINSHSIKVCSELQIPHVRLLGKQAYVFKSKELLIIDPSTYESKSYPHELSHISTVENCSKGILVAGTHANHKVVSYFSQGKQLLRQNVKKLPNLIRYIPNHKTVVFGSDHDIRLMLLDQNTYKLTDLMAMDLTIKCSSLSVHPRLNKIVIGDPFKCIVLYDCPFEDRKAMRMTAVATANCPRLCNDVTFLSDVIVTCDKSGGLSCMLPCLNAPNDLQKTNLYVIGGCNIAEEIWTLTQQNDKSVLYGTSMGSIGRISVIPEKTFTMLKKIEELARVGLPLISQGSLLRQPKLGSKHPNCLLDGELFKTLVGLPLTQLQTLLRQQFESAPSVEQLTYAIQSLGRNDTFHSKVNLSL